MIRPKCQGCLGDLQVEYTEAGEPYAWCVRCGWRDERPVEETIPLLEDAPWESEEWNRPVEDDGAAERGVEEDQAEG